MPPLLVLLLLLLAYNVGRVVGRVDVGATVDGADVAMD